MTLIARARVSFGKTPRGLLCPRVKQKAKASDLKDQLAKEDLAEATGQVPASRDEIKSD